MNTNERVHALKILTVLLQDGVSLSQSMGPAANATAFTKELCFGFCRHYFRLQAMADFLMDKRPKVEEVWVALLMGLYQLHYMDIPDYAVVQETVAMLEPLKKGWAKGLINAVLRNFCRKKEVLLAALAKDPAFVYGQSPNLLHHFKKDWPDDWQNIAKANDARPPMTLRVNLRKSSVAEYLHALKEAGIEAKAHAVAREGITLDTPCDVHNLPGFADGVVSVQDGAAQLAVSLLALQPGLRVLDACCAPGGKTCHILESEPNLEACIALDIEPERIKKVQDNLRRLQLEATLVQGDALFPDSWWDKKSFDRILLDAPCSATGVIRRHSDIKLLRTDEDIVAVTKIQQAMLHALWPLLAPGGLLVYATCSVIAAENEQQIAAFVAQEPSCSVVKNQLSWGHATQHGRQNLPGEEAMDGFFYSVLLKNK